MRSCWWLLFLLLIPFHSEAYEPIKVKTIHVYVALCDNENQGIVPVPKKLGQGDLPNSNLYWGALYGVKSFFKFKANEWEIIKSYDPENPIILERVVFKHASDTVFLVADAYKGKDIKYCISDFLLASNHQAKEVITLNDKLLQLGGGAALLAYIGHDGLMEFDVELNFEPIKNKPKPVIILACYSKEFFKTYIKNAEATPILWTTHLMAPEAYTLQAAIEGWIRGESNELIRERAAKAYHKYQKCGISGARNLFTYGF